MFENDSFVREEAVVKNAIDILLDAEAAPSKEPLAGHLKTIHLLRQKDYSWRDIADFLNERGVNTNHSKVFRFYQKNKEEVMFRVPSCAQYVAALKEIKLTDNQKKMLAYHYKAHNRTVTFTELALAADYDDYTSANLQYGTLGRRLGEAMNFDFAPLNDKGDLFYSSSIGSGSVHQNKDGEFLFVMHHELADAIRELNWFSEEAIA